ncbi:variable surface protein - VspE [Brachyspira hampsonii 30446]|uniref:Variable surface protein-VspE n=1 Tax=Brachyspira hampsonii 30446 TaxID=1289135 RepID=A0A2U4FKN4_9SPIR|nr:variable surface family protein [Brachyspira hampsonii]EKV57941.1 variable surface protein - VspE [Brachyspira hampsonii 30446]MBW5394117.1 cell surface protein [Brachyspira hampsonii]OEJ19450.1 cell surface protein [Brachyspira hampsonii]
MKKFLLTVMAILTVASGSVFGMYGADNTWLFFLIHGNQFRARMNQVGFTLGNGTIKGTFGFKANTLINGSILNTSGKNDKNPLEATVSGGIGYTSDAFGIGVGYNYTYSATGTGINTHTPVVTMNFLNNNLRIAIPVSIAIEKSIGGSGALTDRKDYLGLSIPAQIRYYTGIDAFNYIRFEFNYGLNKYDGVTGNQTAKYEAQTIGFQLRLHFLNTVIGNNVTVNPFLRIDFASTIGAKGKANVVFPANTSFDGRLTAWAANAWREATAGEEAYDREAYDLKIIPSISLSVNTDYVNLIFEPGLGYRIQDDGIKGSKLTHSLYWQAYGEIYIRPTQDLEWYFEMDVNNGVPKLQGNPAGNGVPVVFGANTGITWYLPALN